MSDNPFVPKRNQFDVPPVQGTHPEEPLHHVVADIQWKKARRRVYRTAAFIAVLVLTGLVGSLAVIRSMMTRSVTPQVPPMAALQSPTPSVSTPRKAAKPLDRSVPWEIEMMRERGLGISDWEQYGDGGSGTLIINGLSGWDYVIRNHRIRLTSPIHIDYVLDGDKSYSGDWEGSYRAEAEVIQQINRIYRVR